MSVALFKSHVYVVVAAAAATDVRVVVGVAFVVVSIVVSSSDSRRGVFYGRWTSFVLYTFYIINIYRFLKEICIFFMYRKDLKYLNMYNFFFEQSTFERFYLGFFVITHFENNCITSKLACIK